MAWLHCAEFSGWPCIDRMINSGESAKGLAACPYDFCSKWISDPEGTREMVEAMTRPTAGTSECPIDGIPNEKSGTNYQAL